MSGHSLLGRKVLGSIAALGVAGAVWWAMVVASAASAPAITGIAPAGGPVAGGNTVVINGTNLNGATAVMFGDAAAAGFTVDSDTQVTAIAPAHVAGMVDVLVTTADGASENTNADNYTYAAPPAITGLSPNSGSTAGGTSVTIAGSALNGATAVAFGSAAATSFTVNSDIQITAVAPAHDEGSVDVSVTTAGGTTANTAADDYTYVKSNGDDDDDHEADEDKGEGHDKVAICHKPGTPAEKTLLLPEPALSGHLGHGDEMNACDEQEQQSKSRLSSWWAWFRDHDWFRKDDDEDKNQDQEHQASFSKDDSEENHQASFSKDDSEMNSQASFSKDDGDHHEARSDDGRNRSDGNSKGQSNSQSNGRWRGHGR